MSRVVVQRCGLYFIICVIAFLPTCNRSDNMLSRFMRTIILGPPGSGKGTISERIMKDFDLQHLSSGDYLRAHIANKTDIGMKVKKYVDVGELVPDPVIIGLIGSELDVIRDGGSWLLDGFPRTLPQARSMHERHAADMVINLDVPFEVIIDRIKGRWLHESSGRVYHTEFHPPKVPGKDDVTGEPLVQREDDKEETVRKRLAQYQTQTQPVLDFYRKLGLLQEFEGKTSNEIWPKVHKYLATKIEPLQYTRYE